jgi:nucleoside-diphosphate-sugar epimerase
LITGANGFVASHLARTLYAHGYTLILIDIEFDEEHKKFWGKKKVVLLEHDIISFNQSYKVDVVIHTAALTATPQELDWSAEQYLKISLELNFHIIAWAREHQATRFIFISSAGVFARHQTNLNETATPLAKGLYALAKRTTEGLLENLAENEQLEFLSVRLGNVYGEDERPRTSRPTVSLLQRMLNQALEHHCIQVPNESSREWTYVGDIAKLIQRLIEAPQLNHKLYHLVSEESFSALELAQKIQQVLPSVRLEFDAQPLTQLRAPLKSERIQELGFSDWTPFEVGLRNVIETYQGVAA